MPVFLAFFRYPGIGVYDKSQKKGRNLDPASRFSERRMVDRIVDRMVDRMVDSKVDSMV